MTTSPPEEPPAPPSPSMLDRTFLTGIEGVTEVIFVRHGLQVGGTTRVIRDGEQSDPALDELGRRQAERAAEALAEDGPLTAVYTSSLLRAVETAACIASRHGVEPVACEELREVELYRSLPAGMAVTDVVPRLSLRGLPRRFEREHRWDVFPYSESGSELRQRVVAAVEGAIAAHGGERIAVVCHGGVINAYLTDALGLTADMVCHPAHASLSRVLALGARRVVHSLNETGHLRAGPDLPDLVTY